MEIKDDRRKKVKYELTKETVEIDGGIKLYRIKALKSFSDVHEGDLGGFVQSESNLSQEGNCWLYGDAKAYENAKLLDNAWASYQAEIHENAVLKENVGIMSSVNIAGNSILAGTITILGETDVYGMARLVYTGKQHSNVINHYLVFIKSAYVWDAQAYIGAKLPRCVDSIYVDPFYQSKWWDVRGDVLVAELDAHSESEVRERIRKVYPEADDSVFRIVKTGGTGYDQNP